MCLKILLVLCHLNDSVSSVQWPGFEFNGIVCSTVKMFRYFLLIPLTKNLLYQYGKIWEAKKRKTTFLLLLYKFNEYQGGGSFL